MVTLKDYYKILGVGRDADGAAIRRAYRRLALQYHPDRNKARRAAARFLEIQEAYAVLADPERRRQYDRVLPRSATRLEAVKARATAPQAAATLSRRLFHVVVEGLGLSLGASLETRSISERGGPRRSARQGTGTRKATDRSRRAGAR